MKCEFHRDHLKFLGMIVGNSLVKMDPKKVEAVTNWPEPRTRRELQSFLGFCNYYRRFIQDFTEIARPLHALTRKSKEEKEANEQRRTSGAVPIQWGDEEQKAFDLLKAAIAKEPVLGQPLDDAPFRVESDASDHALGGVLSQEVDGVWWPVTFYS